MSIKLNGATNGSVELDVPAAIGSDLRVTIPATAGELTVKATDGSVDLGAIDIAASAPADSVNIDSSGNVGIGTTSPTQKLHIYDTNTAYLQLTTAGSTQTASGGFQLIHNGAGDLRANIVQRENAPMTFLTNDIERMRIANDGALFSVPVYNSTTGAAANVSIGSNGHFQRSTSSAKYKTDIETLEDSYADALLNIRPVWYRSTCDTDDPAHSLWGFIAEEVAAIDPRLVQYKTTEAVVQEDGSLEHVPCDPEPEGVSYDRFVPHLLNLIKRQNARIETLEAEVTALKGGAS